MTRLRPALMACALAVAVAPLPLPLGAQQTVETAAPTPDADQLFAVAEQYRTGQGVLQSYAKAADWYLIGVEQGDMRAMHQLGRQLIAGLGVQANPEQGLALLELAAQSGRADILLDLANALLEGASGAPDPQRAAQVYALAVQAGSDEAAVSLALLYQEGQGVDQSIERAIELYSGPAERGHARAQNNLGLIYARGGDVPQDYAKALELFTKAAEQDLPSGLRNLAAMHENGFGTPHNEALSQQLLRQAASGGSGQIFLQTDPRIQPIAPEDVDRTFQLAALGDPIANLIAGLYLSERAQNDNIQDLRAAGQAFETAAKRGLPAAMANLGMMMFEGRGVLQDFVEGYAWLTVAASLGQPEALAIRDQLSTVMTIAQINAGQARAEVLWTQTTGRAP